VVAGAPGGIRARFVATFDGPARAIHSAREIAADTAAVGIEIRAGIHTGESEIRDDDIGGIAVHVAARILAEADPER
jgi:class 3 adenylate cyclase